MEKKQRRKNTVDLSNLVYGKVPPQAREMEEAVLGAILLEKEAFSEVDNILRDFCFYVDSNQRIYRTISEMKNKYLPVDILTVAEKLKDQEELDMIGGPYYLTKLTNVVVSSANIVSHAKIVFQKFIKRQIINVTGELINDCYDDSSIDPFDLLDEAITKLKAIYDLLTTDNVNLADVAISIITELEERMKYAQLGIQNPRDVFTGIEQWDNINGSLFPGLYVCAGRPGMGKGVHMTESICKSAKQDPVGVINGEMTNKQLLIRIGCNMLQLNNFLWKKKGHEITVEDMIDVNSAMEEASTLKLFVHDKRDAHGIRKKIRYWVTKCGVKKVYIDFLGMLTLSEDYSKYKSETEITNYILDILISCCKDFEIPIILYVQLNRELYKSGNKEPNLSHLKQSGKIEELAYQVSFFHRPEYYDPENPVDEMGFSTKGLMYQIVAKHRDGVLGRLKYKFLPQFSKLDDWDYQPAVAGWVPKQDAPF